ncbi:hypothetical protein TRFO_35965 [Tritrichomonas foetus]|uniref:Uncharacterized protein n=1 Tax=Tritrichomonas foetus TaxID=1144522 RepID=A0A1J4JF37_9EUKA|nr:hypothetical protein TRFO_35965 [Tritrichomonas foetus]|eukprot:OHS97754.1 hypothetical protein TRFO_35965 [Tritrichomonas foetus]
MSNKRTPFAPITRNQNIIRTNEPIKQKAEAKPRSQSFNFQVNNDFAISNSQEQTRKSNDFNEDEYTELWNNEQYNLNLSQALQNTNNMNAQLESELCNSCSIDQLKNMIYEQQMLNQALYDEYMKLQNPNYSQFWNEEQYNKNLFNAINSTNTMNSLIEQELGDSFNLDQLLAQYHEQQRLNQQLYNEYIKLRERCQ